MDKAEPRCDTCGRNEKETYMLAGQIAPGEWDYHNLDRYSVHRCTWCRRASVIRSLLDNEAENDSWQLYVSGRTNNITKRYVNGSLVDDDALLGSKHK